MRVTNNMLTSNYMNNLSRNMGTLNKYQTQLATNRKITKLSDDPIGAIATLGVRTKISRLEQYKRNVDDAKSWLNQSETSMMEINEVTKSLYEQVISASSDALSDSDKNATLQYIKQLRSHLIQVGNATIGNRYLFGGYNTTKNPFTINDEGKVIYNNIDLQTADTDIINKLKSQNIEYEIGTGSFIKVSFTGVDIFGSGESNLFAVVDNLIETMENGGNATDIGNFVKPLQDKQQDILVQITEIGGIIKRMDFVEDRYSLDEINYQTIKSNVEDIDVAEVIMKLRLTEASYSAALASGSRIIQPSLADYLR